MRRVFWILITPLAGFLVLWLAGSYFLAPQIEKWALNKIETYSAENLPVRAKAEKFEIGFFRPSVQLSGLTIQGTGELEKALPLARVERIRVRLDLFQLLAGRLSLAGVIIDSPEVNLNIDPFLESDAPPKELPMDQLFSILEDLPLQRILLKEAKVQVSSDKLKFNVNVDKGDLLLTNMGKNLTGKLNFPHLDLKMAKVGDFSGMIDGHLYLTRQSLRIIQLSTRLGNSEVRARGELTRFSQVTIKPSGVISVSANVDLTDIYNEIMRLRPDLKIPALAGNVATEVEAHFDGLKDIKAKALVDTRGLKVDIFELGDARIQGEYQDQTISFSEMRVQHPAGEAIFKKSELELGGNYRFKSTATVTDLDLQKLFHSLDLATIPVGLQLQGELPCEGSVLPSIQVTCSGAKISGRDLWVKAENKPSVPSIVEIDSMSASGQVKVTTQAVSYAAAVTMGTSSGTSDGVIDFAKGFKINYKTPQLELKNVKRLAGLKLVGSSSIDGSTEGDSHAAVFNMNLNARNFIFEDFTLGNLITNLKYRSGVLHFEDIAGAINKTQYIGDLDVDLNKDRLQGEFSVPTADLNDVALVFKNIYELPITVQGVGAAKARIDGPLNFWKMNYKLDSVFRNVFIGPENFDALTFNASATNGNIKADKVVLSRGNSTLNVLGGISSEKVMGLYADGKNWRLEESDIISKVNSNILGNLNFSAELKNAVSDPQILIKGSVVDTYFEEQEIPNSDFILTTTKHSFGGELSLFGDRVKGAFDIPFNAGSRPLAIKMTTKDWNFSSLLGLIGGANLASEYQSNLTSSVDLRSETGDLFKASGSIQASSLALKRGDLSFANQGPVDIAMDRGTVTIRNFHLQGPANNIQIRGNGFTAENLNLAVNAQCDLRLLQIFAPFLEDMGGPVTVAATLSGSVTKPEILGNANANNTYIKIKGFPHAIEKLSTEIVFSQSRVLVNGIRAQLAGGTITGEGGMQINGMKDLPTSVRLHLENVTLNVPDKVRTNGNADLQFAGRWFPFTLSGTYHVLNGLVEKEFTESDGSVAGVKQSLYLPKVIRENNFEPVLLDLQLLIDRNIVVKNSLIDGSVTGQLQVKGPPTNPVLLGRITMERNSKAIFKDKIFEVQNGVIDFNDPDEINPNLYLSANSRIAEYDINLIAQGPSKNLTIRMTSVPPLQEHEIISLIALGVTSSNMEQNLQSRQQAEQLGVEIGGAVLAKPINQLTDSTLGLNFQVTSQYDTIRNISVPKLTLSRRLSEKVKVSYSRPVGDSQSDDIKLEYIINNNFTGIGSFENRGFNENSSLQSTQKESQSIFGLDIEFKREFK